MGTASLRQTGITAVAGGLLLFSGTSFAIADDGSDVQVQAVRASGSQSEVTVENTGYGLRTGQLIVELILDGRRSLLLAPFAVWGGQKAFVTIVPPIPGGSVIRVGIIVDDGAPI